MHRSGTSSTTSALSRLGLQLPDASDLMTDQFDNPSHFESTSLTTFNEELLADFGGPWYAPPELGPDWALSTPAVDRASSALSVASGAYPLSAPAVWKDPRLCLLLPFWRRLLPNVAVVLVWRHPLEVAASLMDRDGLSASHAFALWDRYHRSVLRGLQGLPTLVVSYEEETGNPTAFIRESVRWLSDLGWMPSPESGWRDEGAEQAVDPGLRHHHQEKGNLELPDCLSAMVELLTSLEGAHDSWTVPTLPVAEAWMSDLLAVHRELHTLGVASREGAAAAQETLGQLYEQLRILRELIDDQAGHLARVDEAKEIALAAVADLEGQLTVMRASRSWRMTAPLRSVASRARRNPGSGLPPGAS
jgi:hypothetical protein